MVPPNPNHRFIDRFSIINHPFLGTIYWKNDVGISKSKIHHHHWLVIATTHDIHWYSCKIHIVGHWTNITPIPADPRSWLHSEIDLPYENWSLENTRPGKRLHKTMENHHAINGKIHYFYGHFPVRKLLVYQRVYPSYIPLNPIKSPLNHHWITIFNR